MPGTLDDYEVLETIGSGTYGTCKKVRRKKDGKNFVCKEMQYGHMSDKEKMMIVSEVNLLRELKHEHIVRYYERVVDKATSTIFIIMEYCEGGDLSSIIKSTKREGRYIDEAYIWKVCHQTTLAMSALHGPTKDKKTVLHRDLKPANLFLDANFNVKVGDFGLARVLNHDSSFAKTFVGTPYYMSPEQMSQQLYNEKCDIWSLGCVLYEMAALHPPFMGFSHLDLAKKITAGEYGRISTYYSKDLHHLIATMLNVNSEERPSIDDILKLFNAKADSNKKSEEALDGQCTAQLMAKEISLNEKEIRLRQREEDIKAREKALAEKERELRAKQRALDLKENLTDAKLARAEKMMCSYKKRAKTEAENRPPVTKEYNNKGNYSSGKESTECSTPSHHLTTASRTKFKSPVMRLVSELDYNSPRAKAPEKSDSVNKTMISPILYEGRRKIPGLSGLAGTRPPNCIGGSKPSPNNKTYTLISDALGRIRPKAGESPLVSVEMPEFQLAEGDTLSALKHALKRGLAKAAKPHQAKYLNSKLNGITNGRQDWKTLDLIKLTCQQLERNIPVSGRQPDIQARLEKLRETSSELKRRNREFNYHNRQILAFH